MEVGKSATYLVVLKAPPASTTNYELTVSVPSEGFVICATRIVEMGRNLPCYAITASNYGPLGDQSTSALVKFPQLTNVGMCTY